MIFIHYVIFIPLFIFCRLLMRIIYLYLHLLLTQQVDASQLHQSNAGKHTKRDKTSCLAYLGPNRQVRSIPRSLKERLSEGRKCRRDGRKGCKGWQRQICRNKLRLGTVGSDSFDVCILNKWWDYILTTWW